KGRRRGITQQRVNAEYLAFPPSKGKHRIVRSPAHGGRAADAAASAQPRADPSAYSALEAISEAVHGLDMFRLVRVGLDFLSDGGDVTVYRPRDDFLLDAPDVSEELSACDGSAAILDEVAQDVELQSGEVHLVLASSGLMCREVDLDVTYSVDVHRRTIRGLGSMENRLHPGSQLLCIERLGDVVLGTESETPQDILLLTLGR